MKIAFILLFVPAVLGSTASFSKYLKKEEEKKEKKAQCYYVVYKFAPRGKICPLSQNRFVDIYQNNTATTFTELSGEFHTCMDMIFAMFIDTLLTILIIILFICRNK